MIDRKRAVRAVRSGIGLVALAWLVRAASWERVFDTAGGLGVMAIGVILALSVVETLSRFATWHVLLNRLTPTPFSTAARVTLTVSFVNHLSPSQAVGRSLAPAVLRQYTDLAWSSLVAVAGAHTALYAICYGTAALVGLFFFGPALSVELLLLVGGSVAVYLLVGWLLWFTGRHFEATTSAALAIRDRLPFRRLRLPGSLAARVTDSLPAFGAASTETFRTVTSDRPTVGAFGLGWAVAMLVVPGTRTLLLLEAAGTGFDSPLLLPLVLVTAYAVTLLPVTPGGVGVAEASATFVLAALGIPAGVSASVVLIDRFLGVYFPALLGWIPAMRLDLDAITETSGGDSDG